MARPKRTGLAYFPLDTDYLSDRKVQRILITHGTEGVMVYLTLLCEIYGRNGYYIAYDETIVFDIAFSLKIEETRIDEIIQSCLKVKLFDKKIMQEHGVLTSSGIQERYFSINKRNTRQIDPALFCSPKTTVSVTETPTKGKGNGKGKKTEKEKEKKEEKKEEERLNNFFNQNKYEENEYPNDDARRRAELVRMAADATASAGDA